MSTPKKIRDAYDTTFKKLISTSETSKRIRQFLSSLAKPSGLFNFPIKLSEARPMLPASSKPAVKKSTRKRITTVRARKTATVRASATTRAKKATTVRARKTATVRKRKKGE